MNKSFPFLYFLGGRDRIFLLCSFAIIKRCKIKVKLNRRVLADLSDDGEGGRIFMRKESSKEGVKRLFWERDFA